MTIGLRSINTDYQVSKNGDSKTSYIHIYTLYIHIPIQYVYIRPQLFQQLRYRPPTVLFYKHRV